MSISLSSSVQCERYALAHLTVNLEGCMGLRALVSQPTVIIPHWTAHLYILYQMCDARGALFAVVSSMPLYENTINKTYLSQFFCCVLRQALLPPSPVFQSSRLLCGFAILGAHKCLCFKLLDIFSLLIPKSNAEPHKRLSSDFYGCSNRRAVGGRCFKNKKLHTCLMSGV